MGLLNRFRYKTFSQAGKVNDLITELIRKSIHISSVLVLIPAAYWYVPTLIGICLITLLYCISEFLRMHNRSLYGITNITQHAARQRDKNRFALGPVTLAAGVVFSLSVFPLHTAKLAISALAVGDGLASLIGKRFGKRHLHIAKDKTAAGSLACFTAVVVSSYIISGSFWKSIVLGAAAALIEMLPLKDYDNLLIPIIIGFLALLLGA